MSKGPIYEVELLDSLPLGSGMMRQALPSRADLEEVREISERTVAGYEVLLANYYRLQAEIERLRAENEQLRFANQRLIRYARMEQGGGLTLDEFFDSLKQAGGGENL